MSSHSILANHHRFIRALCFAVLVVSLSAVPAIGSAAGTPGFLTSQPAMLTATSTGGAVLPIISVGDT